MPYVNDDNNKLKLPRARNRRVSVTEADKQRIRELWLGGASINSLGKMGICSKRMVQFILFPERLEHAKELHKLRRADKRYYDAEAHRIAIAGTRAHRRAVLAEIVDIISAHVLIR